MQKKLLLFILGAFTLFSFACGGTAVTSGGTSKIREIKPADARPLVEAAYSQFIDVRTPEEYLAGHAYRARNIPLDTLASNLDQIEKNEPLYIICKTDNRSKQAAQMLLDAGFKEPIVVTGGTEAWKAAGLPMGDKDPVTTSVRLDEATQKALLAALEDERQAMAMYQAVLAKFPDARPFANIINAEKRHESLLLPLFAKYGVTVPKNELDAATMTVPATLAEACAAGAEGERANIALYDGFLSATKESDIKDVFQRLQAASRDNHLPAFLRCEGGMTRGKGRE